ncbi:MAG TPA: hypothetical protein VHH33_02595 [Nitrososphaeraceae archaeon]|jgi:hypothetical protein|nr:hypothetical protein [Nitrososphaeraceae archaeon]
MQYETNMGENFSLLRYGAAGSTFIAGILHLSLVANAIERNFNTGILFLIGGLAQVFWVLPTIRGWNKVWYYVGIGGTLTFILIWVITRFPGNPINGRGGSIGETAIAVEVFQIAYIVLSIIILYRDPKVRK